MIFESNLTKCPYCLRSLTWKSHVRKWVADGEVDEFTFQCETCQRDYLFKDNELFEVRKQYDPSTERLAIERILLHEAAMRRVCPKCGSQLAESPHYWVIWCQRCYQEYLLADGELQPRVIGEPKPKPTIRDFYALHEKR